MATTKVWDRFGEQLLQAPELTLAAFLGHDSSIEIASQHAIRFPKSTDFQVDIAYDPNPQRLDLSEEHLKTTFLIKCLSAWGAETLVKVAHVCSLYQCIHQPFSASAVSQLRNRAANSLQSLLDKPSAEARQNAVQVLQECQHAYEQYQHDPDGPQAEEIWFLLGASWFALETALDNPKARTDVGESEPAQSNATWVARQTVWPGRAADAAARCSSHRLLRQTIRSGLTSWAINRP